MAQRRGGGGSRGSGASPRGSRQGQAEPGGAGQRQAEPGGAGQRQAEPGGAREGGAQRARLREIVEPVVSAAGYDLDGLGVSRAGRRHLVRLTIDGDAGVSLDAVAEVSRQVSAALDAVEAGGRELFAGEYELQVSSPGVDRPLSLPRHWRRNVGRLVQVRVADRQVTGRIVAADDEAVLLDLDGARRELRYDALGAGRIQLEFTRLAALSDTELEDMLDPIDDDETGDRGASDAAVTGQEEREEDEA